MKKRISMVGLALAGSLLAGTALAQTNSIGLPPTLAWSAYDVGSGGYNQAVAIGNALKQTYGVNLRILPGKNDVSRTLPLREGKVQFSVNGVGGSYMAQEGFYDFGGKQWGPQAVRALMLNNSDQVLTAVAAGNAGINTPADMKGKRVAWVIGAPSLNQNITAILAFANLTWDDVQKVEFGGFGAAMDGVAANQADVAFTSSISGKAYALEKSPRGIVYPVMPPEDKAGWARLQAIAPFFVPALGTEGAGLSPEKPAISASYPYPVLMTYVDQDPKLVKAVMTAMVDTFDGYKSAAPGNAGWGMDRQNLEWVIPYHEGAIEYFKSKGVWTAANQKNNDMLIKRQQILADAWKAVMGRQHADDEAFKQDWMKTRAEALTKAGMDPVMTSW
jgi:TRAP transporter TAXI family solute receptor